MAVCVCVCDNSMCCCCVCMCMCARVGATATQVSEHLSRERAALRAAAAAEARAAAAEERARGVRSPEEIEVGGWVRDSGLPPTVRLPCLELPLAGCRRTTRAVRILPEPAQAKPNFMRIM